MTLSTFIDADGLQDTGEESVPQDKRPAKIKADGPDVAPANLKSLKTRGNIGEVYSVSEGDEDGALKGLEKASARRMEFEQRPGPLMSKISEDLQRPAAQVSDNLQSPSAQASEDLRRPPAQAPPAAQCGLGITLKQNPEGNYYVRRVEAGGPADMSGEVRAGDILRSVDGKLVAGISYQELAGLVLGPEDSSVVVSLQDSSTVESRKVVLQRFPIDPAVLKDNERQIEKKRIQKMQLEKAREEEERMQREREEASRREKPVVKPTAGLDGAVSVESTESTAFEERERVKEAEERKAKEAEERKALQERAKQHLMEHMENPEDTERRALEAVLRESGAVKRKDSDGSRRLHIQQPLQSSHAVEDAERQAMEAERKAMERLLLASRTGHEGEGQLNSLFRTPRKSSKPEVLHPSEGSSGHLSARAYSSSASLNSSLSPTSNASKPSPPRDQTPKVLYAQPVADDIPATRSELRRVQVEADAIREAARALDMARAAKQKQQQQQQQEQQHAPGMLGYPDNYRGTMCDYPQPASLPARPEASPVHSSADPDRAVVRAYLQAATAASKSPEPGVRRKDSAGSNQAAHQRINC